MNRIYSVIYSEARSSYVVVSELARRHGRSTRSGRAKAAMTAAVLTALVSFSWTGMTAEAAVQSEPLVVTEKDKVIDDDFQVINHTHPTAIYVDPSSTGTVQVNSDTISVENKGKLENRIGIIHTGNGWNGTLNLKEGMKIRGNFTGPDVDASGVELDGYERLTDDKNTGKPYDGKAYLGNDISIQMNADKATDNASFFGMQSDGEYLQAGDGLSIDMSAHTGNWAEVHGIQICHYGTMNIGDNLSIRVENQLDADTKHNLSDGIITYYNYIEESQNVHAKGRQALSIGCNAHITAEVRNDPNDMHSSDDSEVMGIRLSHTDFTMGNGAVLVTKGAAHLDGTYGINVNHHTVAKIGNDLSNTVTVNGNEHFVTGARVRNLGFPEDADKDIRGSLSIGDRGKTVVSYTGNDEYKNYNATNGLVDDGGDLHIGQDHEVKVTVRNNSDNEGEANGVTVIQNGRMEAKSHFTSILETHDVSYSQGLLTSSSIITLDDYARNEVNAYGQSENAIGYHINGKVDGAEEELSLGNDSVTSVKFAGDYQGNSQILSDLWNYGADTEVKDHASFTVSGNLTKAVPQAITQIRGIYVGNGIGTFGDDLTVHTSGHNYAMVSGIVASADTEKTTNLSVGDNARVTVDATEDKIGTTNQLEKVGGNYIAGIKNSGTGSSVTVGRNAQIQVSAPEDKDASALWVYKNADMTLGDGAVLTVNSAAAENNNVVKADSAGKVTFDGGMTLSGSQNAIYSTGDGSSVTAMGAGRKVILGDLESANKGSIKLNLNTADSLLRGKSIIDGFKPDTTTHGLMAATVETNDASGTASGANMPA
ncbi:MAG: ESPR-type extended signal peptide-containing protein, partial [Selenomonadaceae bacterium]|nr:ESPR-type extended signal peptide-containing protein [Selenomonadaceae bacterium]